MLASAAMPLEARDDNSTWSTFSNAVRPSSCHIPSSMLGHVSVSCDVDRRLDARYHTNLLDRQSPSVNEISMASYNLKPRVSANDCLDKKTWLNQIASAVIPHAAVCKT